MDKPASSDTESKASRETENKASRKTKIGLLAETFCERPRAGQKLCQDAEASCERPEAMRRAGWARTGLVMGPWLTL